MKGTRALPMGRTRRTLQWSRRPIAPLLRRSSYWTRLTASVSAVTLEVVQRSTETQKGV
jgi:hypothetical protein